MEEGPAHCATRATINVIVEVGGAIWAFCPKWPLGPENPEIPEIPEIPDFPDFPDFPFFGFPRARIS